MHLNTVAKALRVDQKVFAVIIMRRDAGGVDRLVVRGAECYGCIGHTVALDTQGCDDTCDPIDRDQPVVTRESLKSGISKGSWRAAQDPRGRDIIRSHIGAQQKAAHTSSHHGPGQQPRGSAYMDRLQQIYPVQYIFGFLGEEAPEFKSSHNPLRICRYRRHPGAGCE